ncbi:MAG: hypothetical protein AAF557_23940 [Pseudomonadota bacterium]
MYKSVFSGLIGVCLAGCSSGDSSPLIFGQGATFGLSVGTAPESGNTPQVTLGFKIADIAIVPTVIPKDIDVGEHGSRRIAAFSEQPNGDRKGKEDALSTFGSFSGDTAVGADGKTEVKLGVFFATGVAAQTLSEGFRCALATKDSNACSFNVTKTVKATE